jgi:hypothetical protein
MFLAALMSASKSPPHVVHTKRAVCTENLIRVDEVMESPKLVE